MALSESAARDVEQLAGSLMNSIRQRNHGRIGPGTEQRMRYALTLVLRGLAEQAESTIELLISTLDDTAWRS